ncbi:MAG TPA: NAD(P)/FAD-dependent oxidoreductase [Stenomitos sp.]
MRKPTAIIIGAGPAGLTAAYELLERSDYRPIVLEMSSMVGGISRTENYKGNRIDIGGHRFFSKSDRVMGWWLNLMPLQSRPGQAVREEIIAYQNKTRTLPGATFERDPETTDQVMLLRSRKSRIYFLRKFFAYPVQLTPDTLLKLGAVRTVKIGLSYLKSTLFPIRSETNLEQFFINRFGRELYHTFFKAYTEKVWGAACQDISSEWGAQRIKGLSVRTAIVHFLKQVFGTRQAGLAQKDTETSLIEQFLYPKYGPGQMWEEVAERVRHMGGEVRHGYRVSRLLTDGKRLTGVEAIHAETGETVHLEGDAVFSTMPVRDLVQALATEVPSEVKAISDALQYRDFITVGLLVNQLKVKEQTPQGQQLIRDNWIYIQEPDVQVGRMQIFNNWSPYMVADPSKVWIGLEYFCNETDELWHLSDEAMKRLVIDELAKIAILEPAEVVDAVVIRVPKAYPGYFGSYEHFGRVREYLDGFSNLFLIGRNGMHRYNNQDHSMLTAMAAVDCLIEGTTDKARIWDINTEEEYHETVKRVPAAEAPAPAHS